MWLLPFIPDFIVHIIAIVGILLTVGAIAFGQIPFIGTYNIPINIIGVVLIIFGFYLEGGISDNEKWQAKVTTLEAKVKASEQQSKDATDRISDLLNEKTKAVKEKQIVIQEKIKEVATKIDSECSVSPDVIEILNNSARKK
jgi:flagellar motor component MotA